MKKKLSSLFIFFILAFFLLSDSFVVAQVSQSSNYKIQLDSVNFGGPNSSSSNFNLADTQGEIATGNSSSSNYSVKAGFRQGSGFACSDLIDNDGDASIDFPNDPSCESFLDDDEGDISIDGGGGDGVIIPAPSCSLSVTPSIIKQGESALLSWSLFNFSGGGEVFPLVGPVFNSGSSTVSPISSTVFNANFKVGTLNVNCQTNLTVATEDEEVGYLSFITEQISVLENAGIVSVGVKRQSGNNGQLQGDFIINNISTNNSDYSFANSILFSDGEDGQKNLTLNINNDNEKEGNEIFTIELSTADPNNRELPYFLTIEIIDDDEEVEELETGNITLIKQVLGGEAGQLDFNFVVGNKIFKSGQTAELFAGQNYTINETGPSGYKNIGISGSLGCPSVLPATVSVNAGENLVCNIINQFNNELIVLNEGDLIPDDDLPVLFSPANQTIIANEGDKKIDIILSPVFIPGTDIFIFVRSLGQTAISELDFSPFNKNLKWSKNDQGQQTLTIDLVDDNILENDESFQVILENSSGDIIQIYQIMIKDNDSCQDKDCQEEFFDRPVESAEQLLNLFTDLLKSVFSEQNKVPIRIASAIGAVAGAASFASTIFSSPLSLGEIFMLPFRIWTLILTALGIRKRSRPWGVVYDSQTKQPLDPVYVSLIDSEGKEVASSLTDLDGRYGFLVKPGQYKILVKKTHYDFPSRKLNQVKSDELYDDLYYGDTITIDKEGEVLAKNIPMDPVGFDWNEYAKNGMKVMRFHVKNALLVARIIQVLFIIGFILAFLAYLFAPEPYNTIIFVFYLLLLLVRVVGLKTKKTGRILALNTKKPLAFSVIKITSPKTGVQIAKRVADQFGRYFALVGPGVYDLAIEEKLPDGSYKKVFSAKNIPAKKGIINQSFYVFDNEGYTQKVLKK